MIRIRMMRIGCEASGPGHSYKFWGVMLAPCIVNISLFMLPNNLWLVSFLWDWMNRHLDFINAKTENDIIYHVITCAGNSLAFLQPNYLLCPSVFSRSMLVFDLFYSIITKHHGIFETTWICVLRLWLFMFSFKISYSLPPLEGVPCGFSVTIINSRFKGRSNSLLVLNPLWHL